MKYSFKIGNLLINNPIFEVLSRNQMIKWRDIKIDVKDPWALLNQELKLTLLD